MSGPVLSPDPPACDCTQVSIRNVRLIAVAAIIIAMIVRAAAFSAGSTGYVFSSIAVGAGFLTYGIATCFAASATFPRWMYVGIALFGVSRIVLACLPS